MMRRLLSVVTLIASAAMFAHAQHKITFIGMSDCPNTPPVRKALKAALLELGWDQAVDELDLVQLAQEKDPRAGFDSPTILVDGRDLFGTKASHDLAPSCRFYPGGPPNRDQVVKKLESFLKPQP